MEYVLFDVFDATMQRLANELKIGPRAFAIRPSAVAPFTWAAER